MRSYKDLTVYQKGYELTLLVYKLTQKFPKEELYGLTSQMRRAAVSILSNTWPVKCLIYKELFHWSRIVG